MTNIDHIQQSQASKEVTANAAFDALSPAGVYGRRQSTSAGLVWGYYGGEVITSSGSYASIADDVIALDANATTYIVVDRATGAVSASTTTTNWDDSANYRQLYRVVTGPATVTSYVDARALMRL